MDQTYKKQEEYEMVKEMEDGFLILNKATGDKQWLTKDEFLSTFTATEDNYVKALQESLQDLELIHNRCAWTRSPSLQNIRFVKK